MFPKHFIAATKEYTTYEKHVAAPLLRRAFTLEKEIKSAEIVICGLGFYELFLNGKKITKGLLAPYISNPDDLLYYDKYDVKDILCLGKNAIGIMLGNGMLNCPGGEVWDFQQASYRSAPKVACRLEITFDDDSSFVIESDESFKVKSSPILFDDLRCGEIYDSRQKTDNWNMPDFDDSAWDCAISAQTPKGDALFCNVEPIVVTKILKPVNIYKSHITHLPKPSAFLPVMSLDEPDEGYLYDFGINTAGNVRLKIRGTAGQKIIMQFGELLAEDGGLDLRAMSFQPHDLNHRNVYICSGEGEEIYAPSFCYHGFRYCLVKGITEDQATTDLLTYEVMNSDLSISGSFSCSDEIVNRLQEAAVVSDLANFYYFPTDCPHREKNGWTADAALSTEHMLINLTPEKSMQEWLRNIRKAMNDEGALPGIVPTCGWGFDWGNGPAWDCVLVYLPYYIWKYRGNTEIIFENEHSIMRYLAYILRKRDDKGLIHIGLGDWVPIGRKKPKTPLEVTDTLMCIHIAKLAETMFNAVNLTVQAGFARSVYDAFRNAARQYLIENDGATVLSRTQTGQAMGLSFGLFDAGEKAGAFKVLLDLIKENNQKLDVGVLGIREIFHVLSDFGYAQLAYDMIVDPEYPSYAHWILKENATSLFEAFQNSKDRPNSKNHHFLGDISAWFYKNIAGIKVNPYDRNCNEVEISPQFLEGISHAKAFETLSCGKLGVAWEKTGDGVHVKLDIPQGCVGIIKLPKGYEFEDGGFSTLPVSNDFCEFNVAKQKPVKF